MGKEIKKTRKSQNLIEIAIDPPHQRMVTPSSFPRERTKKSERWERGSMELLACGLC